MPPSPNGPADGAGLLVAPFRGVRYAPGTVTDLAAVTSPPYDVIDPDDATHLEQLDPHNVVRLILPRDPRGGAAGEGPGRYAHAAELLDEWRAEGVLVRDEQPTLYVYEQSGPGMLQRGLLAAVGLRDPADRVVLPHEDVMPGPVADRLELMRATAANLEPILLVYDGGGDTATVIEQVIAGAPLLETVTEDGLTQRVWAVADPALQERVARDLAPRQALIADGHHRWATYRQLQAEKHASGDGAGPWDRGLAMLVDSRTYPVRVAAIHRVVADLGLDAALAAAAETFQVRAAGTDLESALTALRDSTAAHPFVVTDGKGYHLLEDPDPVALADCVARRPAGSLAVAGCERAARAAAGAGLAGVRRDPAGGLPARRRGRGPGGSSGLRSRRADASRRGGRRAGAGRRRRADAAQVDVVRPEAAHRAGPPPARPLTLSRVSRGGSCR